jgi:DNA-binding CsgD family transcriptional regulator
MARSPLSIDRDIRRRTRSSEMDQDLLRAILARLDREWGEGSSPRPPSNDLTFDIEFRGQRYTITCRRREELQPRVALSPREREIVRLVATGLPNKTIAQVLDISLWTVASHVRRVFTKLGVTSRAEMVAHILRQGLLEPPIDRPAH